MELEFMEIVMFLTRFERMLKEKKPYALLKAVADRAKAMTDRMTEISEQENYTERIDQFECDAFTYSSEDITIINPEQAKEMVAAWKRDFLEMPCARTAKFLVLAGRLNASLSI